MSQCHEGIATNVWVDHKESCHLYCISYQEVGRDTACGKSIEHYEPKVKVTMREC